MAAPQGDKRTPRPTLNQLRDDLHDKARDLLATITPINDDESVDDLNQRINVCRIASTHYLNTFQLLSSRVVEVGSVAESGELRSEKRSIREKVNQYRQSLNTALGEAHCDDACSLWSASTRTSLNSAVGSTSSVTSSKREMLATKLQVARATSQLHVEEDQLEFKAKELERETSRRRDQLELERRRLQRRKETEALVAELSILDEQIDPFLTLHGSPSEPFCVDSEQAPVNSILPTNNPAPLNAQPKPLQRFSTHENPLEAMDHSSSRDSHNPFLGVESYDCQFPGPDSGRWHEEVFPPYPRCSKAPRIRSRKI